MLSLRVLQIDVIVMIVIMTTCINYVVHIMQFHMYINIVLMYANN